MIDELGGMRGRAACLQIVWRGDEAARRGGDDAGSVLAVDRSTDAQRNVHAVADQVDVAIHVQQLELETRMRVEQAGDVGGDVALPKHDRQADANPTGERPVLTAKLEDRLIPGREQALGVPIEALSTLRHADRPGRAVEELHVELVLQPCDPTAHGGLAQPQVAGGGGERAEFDDANEAVQCLKAVHRSRLGLLRIMHKSYA